MQLKDGEIVTVAHYSEGSPFKSVVFQAGNDTVTLKLTREFSAYNLFEGDPIVLGFQVGNEIYISECIIHVINLKEGIVEVKIDNTEFITDKRVYERFPVSLYADVRSDSSRKRSVCFIKNLSLEGLGIVSKDEFTEGQEIELDIYIDKRVLPLTGVVTRKKSVMSSYEYGLKIFYKDFNTKNSLKLHLKILKDEQEKALNN
ncbi:MAG: PilZ domain-containing protein [Bacillota bacterium]